MEKIVKYLTAVAVLFCITSCSDDKEDHLEQWMITNVNAFNAIKANPEYKELKSLGNEGSIYYKVLKSGDGTDSIKYTSAVACYYKGWLIADYPNYNIKAGDVFDKRLLDDSPPASFYFYNPQTGGIINGWKTALQHMVKGDKWEIWIPYQLGYGRIGSYDQNTGRVTIPGYSTLVFEIEVVSIKEIDD